MGDRSEAFCRQPLTVLADRPQVVPPDLSPPDAMADLAVLDVLRPRLEKLRQPTERADDTELALAGVRL